MANDKISTLLSDVSIEGDIIEKDKMIVDAKINGDIKSEEIETHLNSNIKGNIKSKKTFIAGKLKGDINSDSVHIRKTADVDGTIKQKKLSIEEGSLLTIKTEIKK